MGWLLAARSATFMDAVRSSARERSVQAVATRENPLPSGSPYPSQRPYILEDDIWKRWMLEAGDSGKSSGPWARQGVPLGEEVPIDARGSPPKRWEERGDQAAPDVQEAFMSGFKNEGAKKEGEHYLAAGYGIKVEWNKALKEDPHGTIAKPTSVGKRTPRTPAVLHGALR